MIGSKTTTSWHALCLLGPLVGIAPLFNLHADSVLDTIDARSIGMGEARRAEAFGAASTSLNPSGLSLNKQLVFDGGFGFNTENGDKLARVAACDSTVPVGGCFFYNYQSLDFTPDFDSDNQSYHLFGATSARALTNQLHVGFTVKYVNFGGASDESGWAGDVGFTLGFGKGIRLAGVGYNLYHSVDHIEFERAFAAAISVRPGNGALALNGDAYWNTEQAGDTGRYSGGVEYFFSPSRTTSYPIRLGAIHDRNLSNTYVSGGFGLQTVRIGFDVGIRRQVSDGDEWLFQGSLNLITK